MILSEKETYWAADKLVNFFNSFNRIDEYFRKRKIERIKKFPTPLFGMGPEDDLFQAWDMHPEDMEFEVVTRTREVFENLLEMTASFTPDDPPARVTKICVQEKNTGKICGFIKLASPLINAKPRNDWLGRPLNGQDKAEMSKFNDSTIMGFVIVPAQPFGFNYLGGKLMAAICCSHEIRRRMNKKYGGPFCLFETTSLYGNIKGMSMYDGMRPFLKYRGDTLSKLFLNLDDDVYFEIRDWFYEKNGGKPLIPMTTEAGTPITGHKLRTQSKIISIITNSLKHHNQEAYQKFMEFKKSAGEITTQKRFYNSTYGFSNSREFLLGETETLIKSDTYDKYELDNIVKWWKKKASKRYDSIKEDGRLRREIEVWKRDNIDTLDIIR